METPAIQLLGLTILQPTTCLTNLILAVECWVLFRLLRKRPKSSPETGTAEPGVTSSQGPPSGSSGEKAPDHAISDWRLFFLFVGVASLLGIPKHGFVEVFPARAMTLVIYASSLSGGFGVLFAEWATILTRCRSREGRSQLILASYLKVALFGTILAFTMSMTTVIVNAALGLTAIMVVEGVAFFRGDRSGGWVAGGLALSALAAPVHLLEHSPHAWFNHDDLAHVLLMMTLAMVYRGVRARASS